MAYDGGSVTCGCIMSRTVWPWLANAVALPGCDQAPDVTAAGELRYFCCECAGVSYPAVPLVGVPSLTCISRLRHRRPGTSAGGAEVALAAARLRKATAQPKVSSTVRPAKYAS